MNSVRHVSALFVTLLSACTIPPLGTEEATLDAAGLSRLVVDTFEGDLAIRGDAEATEVLVRVTVWGAPGAGALDDLDLSLEPVGEGEAWLRVALHGHPMAWADVAVTVPSDLAIAGDDGSGDLLVEGVGAVDLRDDSGDFVVRDVAGDVRVEDGSGDLRVEGVGGDVVVFDGSGDLVILDVGGDVDVEDGSGDVNVDRVDGTLAVLDDSGDIRVGDVGEFVLVGDGSGDVRF